MFTLTVLGSGSAGNCALLATERCHVLIDAGLSARQMVQRLEQVGVAPEQLDGILLTHEHGDHCSGLEVLCRRFASVPIYCNALTADALRHAGCLRDHRHWRLFPTSGDFEICDIAVQAFPVPHDAVDPVGFMFHHSTAALGLLTDLGFATKLVHERVKAATTLLIETNHDSALLSACTKRPWSVKQRIMSRHGHLSNAAAAGVVGQVLQGGGQLRRAVLGHLSRDCNRPELALAAMRTTRGTDGGALEIHCASQGEISARMIIETVAPAKPNIGFSARNAAAAAGLRVAEAAVALSLQMDLFGALAI
jgi:phosphoribosyl 1,2-cyclic phosphodiesterase